MTQPKTNRIPAPIYAAAGAGELALQQLRRLPTVVGELRDRAVADGGRVVSELGGKAVVTGFELRQKANDTLRNANRTAESLRQKAAPAADLNRLREHADLAKLREAADLHKLRETADLNKLRGAADLDRLRELATRNAAAVVAGARPLRSGRWPRTGRWWRGVSGSSAPVCWEVADTVNTDIEATEASVPPRLPLPPRRPHRPPSSRPTPHRPRCRARPRWPRSWRPSRLPRRRPPGRSRPPGRPPPSGPTARRRSSPGAPSGASESAAARDRPVATDPGSPA